MEIDTIRLRALHTQCKSIAYIAAELGTTVIAVEETMRYLGLKPHDKETYVVEPNSIIAEINAKNVPDAKEERTKHVKIIGYKR